MTGNRQETEPLYLEEAIRETERLRAGKVGRFENYSSGLGWASALLLLLTTFLLVFGSYRRRENAMGYVVSRAGVARIRAPESVRVAEVLAEPGQHVSTHQKLIVFSSLNESLQQGRTDELVSKELQEQIRVNAQAIATENDSQRLELSELKVQRAAKLDGIAKLEEQLRLADAESMLGRDLLGRYETAEQSKVVAQVQVIQQHSQLLELESRKKSLQVQLDSERAALSQIVDSIHRSPLAAQQRIASLKSQSLDAQQRLAESETRGSRIVTAPDNAIVADVLAKAGDTVAPGDTLMTLVPTGAPLDAELYLPTSSVGFLQEGDPVSLQVRAFPYQKFGTLRGKIRAISKTAMRPTDIAAMTGGPAPQEPLYRATVSLDTETINTNSGRKKLAPGMALDAQVLLEKRSLVEWLFEPLFSLRNKT